MKTMTIKVTMITPTLGTYPSDPETFVNFLENRKEAEHNITLSPERKALEREELERALEMIRINRLNINGENQDANGNDPKLLTVFPRNKNYDPVLYDYQFKGFLKEACKSLKQYFPNEKCSVNATKAGRTYKSLVDAAIFVKERAMAIHLPDDGIITICSRPLRVDFPERVCIASSEQIPAGSWFNAEIYYPNAYEDLIIELLNYGKFKGFLQWRSGGKGSFKYEVVSIVEDEPLVKSSTTSDNEEPKKRGRKKKTDDVVA